MSDTDFGEWNDMASAPKDGSRVLVAVKASEQGPAEVDVARWAKAARAGDVAWIAADSDPGCVIAYSEAELAGWMPLPTPTPKLTPRRQRPARKDFPDEIGGSGI
jgi:hypothetical protein